MPQSGFFCWHVHHGILLEWCYDYDERAEYVRTGKPPYEQALRLRLFQLIKGQLAQEVVEAGKAYGEAGKAYDEAGKAYDEAGKVWFGIRNVWFGIRKKASREARKALNEARNAYIDARNAYIDAEKAHRKALSNHRDEIEALHKDECRPDCPWDGETIFPAAYAA